MCVCVCLQLHEFLWAHERRYVKADLRDDVSFDKLPYTVHLIKKSARLPPLCSVCVCVCACLCV